jgi:ADP-dependent phosphofructokinase/glucokinase
MGGVKQVRTIACGFTADIDLIAKLTQPFYEEIKKYASGVPKPVLHTWDDFSTAVAWNVKKASGAEYIIANQELIEHMVKQLEWRKAIGGAGLQAGCVASYAGYSALVNIPIQSKELTSLVSDQEGLMLLSDQEGEAPKHYILEYEAGGSSNRIIFRRSNEYPRDMIAVNFVNELRKKDIAWMLTAGFNAVDGSKEVDILLQDTINMLETLKNKRPKVHLELASIWSLDEQWKIIRTLGNYVETIGLNEDEYQQLIALKEPLLSLPDEDLVNILGDASHNLGAAHVILHTKEFSFIQSAQYDTSLWRNALINGNKFAFSRAVTGEICNQDTIQKITSCSPIHPRGEKLQELTKDRNDMTIVPAYIGETISTTGLGDTFTAGLLVEAPVEFITFV